MHLESLDEAQKEIFPKLNVFDEFSLVGGTALALQLGHRKSVDFDLFSNKNFEVTNIKHRLQQIQISIDKVLVDQYEQFSCVGNSVKFTFLVFPFKLTKTLQIKKVSVLDKVSIGALKAYALGRRGKWKDYVDLYFLLHKCSIKEIEERAVQIFGKHFNNKLFREQLCYYGDIDFSEKVEYLTQNPSDDVIKDFLIQAVI